MVTVEDRADLPAGKLAELTRVLAGHVTLEEVVRSELQLVEVVVQDEYTHDVVMLWDAPIHLVYDTT